MQHYVHTHRHMGGQAESYHRLEHGLLGFEQSHLVHQELDELRQFAPLKTARRSGTRITTAKKKLSDLVRYAYLSLF